MNWLKKEDRITAVNKQQHTIRNDPVDLKINQVKLLKVTNKLIEIKIQ